MYQLLKIQQYYYKKLSFFIKCLRFAKLFSKNQNSYENGFL